MSAHDEDGVHDSPDLPAGALVVFVGPEQIRHLIGLAVEHPGRVVSAAEQHADVQGVDRVGWWVQDGVFDPHWLSVIDGDDFRVRSTALRSSGWQAIR